MPVSQAGLPGFLAGLFAEAAAAQAGRLPWRLPSHLSVNNTGPCVAREEAVDHVRTCRTCVPVAR